MPHARYHHGPKLGSRPTLTHPYPTRTVFVITAFPVPRELDFHPSPFVTVNLFSCRPHDMCHLRSIHTGFRVRGWTPLFPMGYQPTFIFVTVAFLARLFFQNAVLPTAMYHPHNQPITIKATSWVARQTETISRDDL